jgi:Rad3-related DNA helicase
VFLLLDERVLSKSYGHVFLKSLPISGILKGNRDKVLGLLAKGSFV